MATVTATYAPATGRQAPTLTSWAGSAAFATTPTAGSQIEGANALTIGVDGVITGADGTYTLHHITTAGVIEADSFVITTADTTAPIISALTAAGTDPDTIDVAFSTDEDNGTSYFFASGSATETAAAIKAGAQGSQDVSATGNQSLMLTLATGTYRIHALHEDTAGNQSNILSSAEIVLAAIPEVGTGTATYAPPANMSLATLADPIDGYLAVDFDSPPEVGEQVLTLTADGAFDSGLNWSGDAEGAFPYWYINNAGAIFQRTITTGSLQSLPDENVVIDSVESTRSTITANFSYSGVDAESFEVRLDDGAWATASSPAIFTVLTAATEYVFAVRPVNANGIPGIPTTRAVTTSPAIDITPTAFSFPALVNVARGVPQVSASATIQGVDAATDVPVTVTGGEYSVSTDNGTTWGGWTSAATNVRLNYRVRLRHTSSAEYSSGGYDGVRTTALTVGGVTGTFRTTTLADTIAPVLSLTGGNVTIEQGQTWVEPGYSAIDAADGDISVSGVVITGSVNTANLGPQSLTYTATDQSGNQAQTTRIVTVVEAIPDDQVKPVITLSGGNIQLQAGDTWVEPGFTAIDAVDGNLTDSVVVIDPVNTAIPGTYTVRYTVSDQAGNTATATRTVTVVSVVQYPIDILAPDYRTVFPGFTVFAGVAGDVFTKAPREKLDYDVDLTEWIAEEADAMDAGALELTVEVDHAGLDVLASGYNAAEDRVKVWLSGGRDGVVYTVSVLVTTGAKRRKKFLFRVATHAYW